MVRENIPLFLNICSWQSILQFQNGNSRWPCLYCYPQSRVIMSQGCKQDVKSQDRDETETVNLQDRDETRRSKKTSRDRLETETQDRDVPKNVSSPQCTVLKHQLVKSHLTTCFLRVRFIIFFVIYSHCMHVHKTKVTRPRPRRYIFKTETRPRRSTLKTETRRDVPKKTSRDRLETETFKTETTSLVPGNVLTSSLDSETLISCNQETCTKN